MPAGRAPADTGTIGRLVIQADRGDPLNRPARVNRPIRALVLAVSLLTAACGGSATAPTPAGSPSPAASTAPASASPSTTSAAPSAASAGNGDALCTFLSSELPALQKAGSTGGAVAQLAIDYANWIAADASRVLPDAAAMDTLTEASCPKVRTDILKLLGGDSFANSL